VRLQLDGPGAHVQLRHRPLADGHAAISVPELELHLPKLEASGYLAGRWESWKWGQNVGAWLVCGTQGWNYGGGYELQVGRSTTGCGAGYYLLSGGTFVYNGGWLGGWINTDYEWLWS
jgi:hypothetical protein